MPPLLCMVSVWNTYKERASQNLRWQNYYYLVSKNGFGPGGPPKLPHRPLRGTNSTGDLFMPSERASDGKAAVEQRAAKACAKRDATAAAAAAAKKRPAGRPRLTSGISSKVISRLNVGLTA